MGKIKQVIMGDEAAEEAARKKATEKRAQKKTEKAVIASHEVAKQSSPEPEKIAASPTKRAPRNDKHDKYTFARGEKYLKAKTLVDNNKVYSLADAIELVKKTSYSSFDGATELLLNVTEKGIRGTVSLPHGTGKKIRVRIADDALIANPVIDFDVLVAHPSMMPKLAKIAKILGPRGLMPNPKTGTIGENVEGLALSMAKGQINFKTETDFPIIHLVIGKVSFEEKKLSENFAALVKAVGKEKIRSAFLKATMGPSIRVQV